MISNGARMHAEMDRQVRRKQIGMPTQPTKNPENGQSKVKLKSTHQHMTEVLNC